MDSHLPQMHSQMPCPKAGSGAGAPTRERKEEGISWSLGKPLVGTLSKFFQIWGRGQRRISWIIVELVSDLNSNKSRQLAPRELCFSRDHYHSNFPAIYGEDPNNTVLFSMPIGTTLWRVKVRLKFAWKATGLQVFSQSLPVHIQVSWSYGTSEL